ncbi:MAG TPA: hypothetical protein VGY58_11600 [Gemmataceae bacterium]|jgi:hypothetical protein|nr:hypothetical protein [Gemmataceae bacterium]
MSLLRDRIANLAQSYVGTVGVYRYLPQQHLSEAALADAGSDDDDDPYAVDNLRGADLLMRMINEAGKNLIFWTPERENAIRAGKWLYVHPLPKQPIATADEDQPGKFDWCGIFATWIWQKAGLDVHWEREDGAIHGNSSLFGFGGPAARFLQPGYIQKGDVCVMNKPGKNNRHHYIVIDADSPTLSTVEGNRSIPRQSIGHGQQDRNLIVAHYRLKVD